MSDDGDLMAQLELLQTYTWPTAEMPLASLVVRVDELATRLAMPIQTWNEDGLGPARGFACRLPSGRVFLLAEWELGIQHQGAKGPNVLVDATDLLAQGIEPLLAEVLNALGLSRSDVTLVADRAVEDMAARLVAQTSGPRA